MDSFWNLYCGQETESLQDNSTLISNDTCVINAIALLPHIIFILSSLLILLCCSCSAYRNVSCVFLLKYPAHAFRWNLLMLFLFFNMFSIGEGIITDFTFHNVSSTQPQLYLPAIFVTLGAIVSLVYYHNCECWQALRLLSILPFYWFLCIAAEALKLYDFHVTDSGGIDVTRYVITVVNLFVYTTLLVLEIFLQCSSCSKVSAVFLFKGCRMGRSDKVSLWYVALLISIRFCFFILE